MRCAKWTETGLEVVEQSPGQLQDGWVRLRVAANGICGTDLHLYRRELPAIPGNTPGHELVGTVLDGPRGLKDVLYAVEPQGLWCGVCELCVAGERHLCPEKKMFGLHLPGGLADSLDVPVETLHPVDPSIPPLLASLSEPLAVAVRAVNLARVDRSSRVLVLGAGTIGLLCGLLARDSVSSVGITARHPHQRGAAERLGLEPIDPAEVRPWTQAGAPDVVIETVGGKAGTLNQAIGACRGAGRIVVLGVFAGASEVNALRLMERELTVCGSNTYGMGHRASEFRSAVERLARYRSELEPLLTHRFPLSEVEDAFACAADKSSGAIKVTVLPG